MQGADTVVRGDFQPLHIDVVAAGQVHDATRGKPAEDLGQVVPGIGIAAGLDGRAAVGSVGTSAQQARVLGGGAAGQRWHTAAPGRADTRAPVVAAIVSRSLVPADAAVRVVRVLLGRFRGTAANDDGVASLRCPLRVAVPFGRVEAVEPPHIFHRAVTACRSRDG